jgi:hypothetical protein
LLDNDSITFEKIRAQNIVSENIKNGAIISSKYGSQSILNDAIKDREITGQKNKGSFYFKR